MQLKMYLRELKAGDLTIIIKYSVAIFTFIFQTFLSYLRTDLIHKNTRYKNISKMLCW